jgi:hypothetical protein
VLFKEKLENVAVANRQFAADGSQVAFEEILVLLGFGGST